MTTFWDQACRVPTVLKREGRSVFLFHSDMGTKVTPRRLTNLFDLVCDLAKSRYARCEPLAPSKEKGRHGNCHHSKAEEHHPVDAAPSAKGMVKHRQSYSDEPPNHWGC